MASVRIRSASLATDLGRNGAEVQRRTSSYIGESKFAWNGIGCSGGSGTGPSLWLRQHRRGGQRPLGGDERSVVDLQHLPDVGEARQRVGVPLLQVVHRVLVAQHPVVRQRVGHHRRIERIVRESCIVRRSHRAHCSGDGGRAARIESSQPSRSAGATLIQVTISAGGLSFHDG